jgi:hypothetical protein
MRLLPRARLWGIGVKQTAGLRPAVRKEEKDRTMRFFGRGRALVVGAAACIAMLTTSATGFAAQDAVGAVNGGGSISPGLTLTSTPQTFTFGGTLDAVGADTNGDVFTTTGATCTFSGSSNAGETLATGAGTGSGSCSGPGTIVHGATTQAATFSASCTINYTRVAGGVLVTGSCTVSVLGITITINFSTTIKVVCSFEATVAPPVVSFKLQCVIYIN